MALNSLHLLQFDRDQGRLIFASDGLHFDNAEHIAEALIDMLSASVVEKQIDADLHSWLIDFEGCQLLLKTEHYSGSLWLETLGGEGVDELAFIAGWWPSQIA